MDDSGITVAELRSAVQRLLDDVEGKFGPTLSFPDDYYWNVPFDRACVLDAQPSLDMGSVCDDVESVHEFLCRDSDEPTTIWHEAEHIGGILRAITRLDMPDLT